MDAGGIGSRVHGSLVHQRLEHDGKAVSVLLRDGHELSPVQEGADAVGGCEVGAPEGREVDARSDTLEALAHSVEHLLPHRSIAARLLPSMDVFDGAAEGVCMGGALEAPDCCRELLAAAADEQQAGLGSIQTLPRGTLKDRHGCEEGRDRAGLPVSEQHLGVVRILHHHVWREREGIYRRRGLW
jgi:hypothetical protein